MTVSCTILTVFRSSAQQNSKGIVTRPVTGWWFRWHSWLMLRACTLMMQAVFSSVISDAGERCFTCYNVFLRNRQLEAVLLVHTYMSKLHITIGYDFRQLIKRTICLINNRYAFTHCASTLLRSYPLLSTTTGLIRYHYSSGAGRSSAVAEDLVVIWSSYHRRMYVLVGIRKFALICELHWPCSRRVHFQLSNIHDLTINQGSL